MSQESIDQMQYAAACESFDAAKAANLSNTRRSYWATVFGLSPYRDGDRWCVLLGKNLHEGICGFGETPEAAILSFEAAMSSKPEKGAAP